jgi:hypothetical protein
MERRVFARAPIAGAPEHARGTAVHEPLELWLASCALDQSFRALDVRAVILVWRLSGFEELAGEVEDEDDVVGCRRDGVLVTHVTDDDLHTLPGQTRRLCFGTNQRARRYPGVDEPPEQRPSQEPRRTRDQDAAGRKTFDQRVGAHPARAVGP